MIKALQSELSINVVASIIVSLLFLTAGFLWGKYKERRREFGRNLEEYDFYPFTVTRENFGEFSLKDFGWACITSSRTKIIRLRGSSFLSASKTTFAHNSNPLSRRCTRSCLKNTTAKRSLTT